MMIQIRKNFRGLYDMEIGTIEGRIGYSNFTKMELIRAISDEIEASK